MNFRCNFTTCRFNEDGKCTNEELREQCVDMSRKVLCITKDKITVGDIVRRTKSYWGGELNEPPLSEKSKQVLFKVKSISRLGCEIENLENGNSSAWWSFDCLELVKNHTDYKEM